jgi:hypothetical protein
LRRNGRRAPAPPDPEPERGWSPSDIFNVGLNEEDIAESILMDAMYEVNAEWEAAEEEHQPVADLQQVAIPELLHIMDVDG